ncbi:MAG: hypothetical protein KIT84_00865 [Labilithrix sp.]|nr:hypothetical protein [Labilithrix sp.]MCW5809535.1 hypothetical protein [Labilithrix sp.]
MIRAAAAISFLSLSACAAFDAEPPPPAPAATTTTNDAPPPPEPESAPAPAARPSFTCAELPALPADATFTFADPRVGPTVKDVYVLEHLTSVPGPNGQLEHRRTLTIGLSSWTHVCAVRESTTKPGAVDEWGVQITARGAEPATFGPGTYDASTGLEARAFSELGASCAKNPIDEAPLDQGFRLTISEKTSSLLAGTLAVTYADGTRLDLTFRAPICASPDPAPEPTLCCAP